MRLKRYVLIIIVILLLTQIFRIYNIWVKLVNYEEFQFNFLFSGAEPKCQYFLNNWQFSLENCNNYQTGSEIRLIGRLTPSSDKQFFKTKKLNVRLISVHKNTLSSGMAWMMKLIVWITTVRDKVVASVMGYLPTAHFSLLMDMPFGQVVKLPDPVYQQLKTIGMLHVVAASGYNVALIASLVKGFVARFGPFQKRGIWWLGMGLYLMLSDRSVSIQRAYFMFGLASLGATLGRHYHNLFSLTTAFFVFLLLEPWLIFSLSFQLSFGATLGIIFFASTLMGFFKKLSKLANNHFFGTYVAEPLSISLATQLVTIPILIFHFGEVTIFSFVSNLLLLWLTPILTIGGLGLFFLGAINLLLPILGQIISLYSLYLWLYTNLFLTISAWLAEQSIFQWKISLEYWRVFVIAMAIGAIIIYNQHQNEKKTNFSVYRYLAN